MRRFALLTLGLLLGAALPASAQNWITVNGTNQLSASSSGPGVAIRQSGAGPAWCVQSPTTGANLWCVDKNGVVTSTVAAQTFAVNGIAATSTNALTLANTTASTASTTVQMPPNLKWCGSAYNSTSALSETDCFFGEVLPATNAGTTTATWKLGDTINGGAAVYPFQVISGINPLTYNAGSATLLGADATISIGGTSNRLATISAVTANVTAYDMNAGTVWVNGNAPTISSGFGSSPSIASNNGTGAFTVNVGTGAAASSGVIGLPTATTGWNCFVNDITAAAANVAYNTRQTASTTATATVQNQTTSTGAAIAWAASDILRVSCFAY